MAEKNSPREHKQGAGNAEDDEIVPSMTEDQQAQAESRTSIPALVIHEVIRKNGEEELLRPMSALAWSGLAAGLSMGFSFLTQGLLWSGLPDAPWRHLVSSFGYPVGFLIVILGRQQLFTENTLTAIIPLLARRKVEVFRSVMKLWGVVLAANLVGAHLFAWAVSSTPVASEKVQQALQHIALEAADVTPGVAVLRGIFAGWLIAMVVWMLAATQTQRIFVIVILTYVVGLAGLSHVVVGSVEVLFLVMTGVKTWASYMTGYMFPALVGNIIGGVSLVSALNHAQVTAGQSVARRAEENRLQNPRR